MSERPMMQSLYSPVLQQGIIASRSMIDHDLVRQFQENAENAAIASGCIAGGASELNHDINQADLIMGLKNCRNADIAETESCEFGIAGLGGFHWAACCSQQEAEDQFYFIGAALTEQRLSSPLDLGTYDPDHGGAHAICGALSLVNTGNRPIYAGNLVAWSMPMLPYHPKSSGLFNDGETINKAARGGNPATQFKFQISPFDYSDFSVQFAGSFAAFQQDKADNGIKDIPYEWTLCNNDASRRQFSNVQDQSFAFKFGLGGIILSAVEALVRNGVLMHATNANADARGTAMDVADKLGLFKKDFNPLLRELMADIFMQNISVGDDARTEAQARFGRDISQVASKVPGNADEYYDRLRLHALDQLVQGIAIAWHSKTEKIIGRAFNCAATSETTDVCLGHFAI